MSPVRALLLAALCTPMSSALAQEPTESDRQEFRETQSRFTARMVELAADTEAFVAYREQSERDKLTHGYDALISSLQALEDSRRDQAIEVLSSFLERYPSAPDSSHVRFRLAELEFELATDDWMPAMEAWQTSVDRSPETAVAPPPPQVDMTVPVALYERILADNLHLPAESRYAHLDGVLYMLAWSHKERRSSAYDPDVTHHRFSELLASFPESDFREPAHLFLGNKAFEEAELETAVLHYGAVVELDGAYTNEGQYQLAWALYRLSETPQDYEQALGAFAGVMDSGDADYRPDALRYIGISLSDVSDATAQPPTQVAAAWFGHLGERDWEHEAQVALAQVLVEQARIDQAIELYTALQDDPRWVHHPDNPALQAEVARLHMRGAFPDGVASAAARTQLGLRYGEGARWWQENRTDAAALFRARALVEGAMGDVALALGQQAERTGEAADYAVAAERFSDYIDRFPMADDHDEMEWYLAATLAGAGELDQAASHYDALVRSRRYHPYGDGAVFQAMRVRAAIATDGPGGLAGLPDEPMTPVHRAFIASADRALGWVWTPAEGDLPDYGAVMDRERAAVLHNVGFTLFQHGHYAQARTYLEQVVGQYRRTSHGRSAGGIIVDSYAAEEDYAAVARVTRELLEDPPGEAVGDPGPFRDALAWAEFQACRQQSETDRLAGAGCFSAYAVAFGDSEHHNAALLNAANGFEVSGERIRSNELLVSWLEHYADDPRAEGLQWRVAGSYESVFELELAVENYLQLVERFPQGVNAPHALANAALLQQSLGDHLGSARTRERYGQEFPLDAAAEQQTFLAGEMWQEVSSNQERRFWDRYLKTWGGVSPGHSLHARYRLAEIADARGQQRVKRFQLDEVLAEFHRYVDAGVPLDRDARRYAAESAFREVDAAGVKLASQKLTGRAERDVPFLLDELPGQVQEFEALALSIVSYGDFDHSARALYVAGGVHLAYAQLGRELMQCPPELDDERCDLFIQVIDEVGLADVIQSHDDRAAALWLKAVSSSVEQGVVSPWVDACYGALNEYNPALYPAVKIEKRGPASAAFHPPVSMRRPSADDALPVLVEP